MKAIAATLLAAPAFAFAMACAAPAQAETAIFAGGCFWCVEKDMDHIRGVTATTSGFAGGTAEDPSYRSHDGYTEAVKVEFDESLISYQDLTARFLRTIDVTDGEGQFCDRGDSYVPAIFYASESQKAAAELAVADAEKTLGKALAVPVRKHTQFGAAEDYHQDYYKGENRVLTRFGYIRQSEAYANYRKACGRDARVRKVWGAEAYTDGKGGQS